MTGRGLGELVGQWLRDMEADHDRLTVKSYGYYSRHWPWSCVDELTDASIHDYLRSQLRVVTAKTVRKKKSAISQLCFWLVEQGFMARRPEIGALPRRATGTRDTKRRHKSAPVPLTMEQALAWISELPERAWPGRDRSRWFWVRPRFLVALLTGLRPATLSEIAAPGDYQRGASELRIRDEIDKARWGRTLALTPETRAALDMVCPEVGTIFGYHSFDGLLRRAARRALPREIAEKVTAYDLRHCVLTWMLERTQNLSGVAFQSGHRRVDTLAAYYCHPSRRAQESAIRDCQRAQQLEMFDDEHGPHRR